MPVRTRTQTARAADATRLPAQTSIQAFAKAVKPGARESTGKGALSLKRKLGDLEESESDGIPLAGVKVPKLEKKGVPSCPTSCPAPKETQIAADSTSISDQTISSSEQCSEVQSTTYHDFISLHSSFVKALSLHFSHNGSTVPANVRDLFPTMERIWKKRRVTVEDIQRLLYIQEYSTPPSGTARLRLSDDGTTCCVERIDARPQNLRALFKLPVNETEMTSRFSRNLDNFRRNHLKNTEDQTADFARSIPLATIHKCGAALKPRNFIRQQLLDIQAGTIKLKAIDTNRKTKDAAAAARESSSLLNRKNGLLQRIQAKSRQQAALPPPPSKETILRRSAVDRLPEVINVLLLLTPPMTSNSDLSPHSPPKKPFRVDTIVQNIQDSMRNPISKEVIEACLDILSQREVAGDWITIVTLSRFKSVVLKGGAAPSSREIIQRVADLKI
ncbi:hypothetical protein VTO42DRAFT_3214 [Malbranchea cinnamomea]